MALIEDISKPEGAQEVCIAMGGKERQRDQWDSALDSSSESLHTVSKFKDTRYHLQEI
jgi:hypothetical protein